MDLRLSDIPGLAIERATNSLLDTVGVTLPGLEEPATRIAVQLAASDNAAPGASVIGGAMKTATEWAAFVNGIAGHALDYDDVSYAVIGHRSVVVLPAVLAVAAATGASGESALLAYAR